MKDKEYYEKLGWVFSEDVWYDGHNNDRNVDKTFKSPRMQRFSNYSTIDNLDFTEAHIFAWDAVLDLESKVIVSKALTDYYLKNPNATNVPKFKVTVENPL